MRPPANCCGCTAKRKARAARPPLASSRAAASPGGRTGQDERILYVTPGYRLIALDAKTGVPVPTFGKAGVVDLKLDDDQQIDLVTGEVGLHATPLVAGNTVIVGAAHLAGGEPKSKSNVKGYVRGFDVKTGKRLWIFHTIPKPGEFGYDTWEKDSAEYTGNTGVWAQISVDEDLGMAYLPVELPTGDYYGGHRPGNGLFGESIVAVDLKTGQRKWHYQLVHHGMWDMDIPCAPMLVDITVNGQPVKALAQPTKQSILYVFNRVTGEPIWPIVEKPVPQGDVPGEWYSPTQPIPTKPPPYGRNGFSVDDVIDFTPELKAQALQLICEIDGGVFSHHQIDSRARLRFEILLGRVDLIAADRNRRGGIAAGIVGNQTSLGAGFQILDDYCGSGDGSAGLVLDDAGDTRANYLSPGKAGYEGQNGEIK